MWSDGEQHPLCDRAARTPDIPRDGAGSPQVAHGCHLGSRELAAGHRICKFVWCRCRGAFFFVLRYLFCLLVFVFFVVFVVVVVVLLSFLGFGGVFWGFGGVFWRAGSPVKPPTRCMKVSTIWAAQKTAPQSTGFGTPFWTDSWTQNGDPRSLPRPSCSPVSAGCCLNIEPPEPQKTLFSICF